MSDSSTLQLRSCLSIRVDLPAGRFGPGKAALLEAIAQAGSIAAAARALGMSYARASSLTRDMNAMFSEPLVATFAGGNRRGGARLTAAGEKVAALYLAINRAAEHAVANDLSALAACSRSAPPG